MSPEEYEEYAKLGYNMNAIVGKDGVEAAFESYLHGNDGTQTITVTSSGAVKNVIYSEPPVPGKNVVLTLDIGLQGAAENILAERIGRGARRGDGGRRNNGCLRLIHFDLPFFFKPSC